MDKNILNWLKTNTQTHQTMIAKMGVFGSVARGEPKPNDCDLLIVPYHDPNHKNWNLLRLFLDQLTIQFKKQFALKLSIQVLNISEWNEMKNVFFTQIIMIELPNKAN